MTWRLTTPALVSSNHGIQGRSLVPIKYDPASDASASLPSHVERPLVMVTTRDLMATLHSHTTWGPAADPEKQFWKNSFVSDAQSHDFIHSCLSSLVCLLGETRDLHNGGLSTMKAYQDHVAAISSFRKAAMDVSKRNWSVILVFGVSVVVFEFGAQQISPDSEFDYMHTFRVLRMSMNVVNTTGPFLKQSELWQYISKQDLRGPTRLAESLSAIAELEECVISTGDPVENEEDPILEAVKELKQWTQSVHASPWKWADLIRYPGLVSAAYVDKLAAEEDLALLVFIYWCAIMQLGWNQVERWFLHRWPQRAVLAAVARLSGKWSEVLKWPLSVFSLDPEVMSGDQNDLFTISPPLFENEMSPGPSMLEPNYMMNETGITSNIRDVSFLDEYG